MSETQSVCKHCGRPIKSGEYCRRHRNAEPVAEPASTGEPPDKSDEAFWKYLDENREVVIRWPGWMRGESILEAARPSGPSAPQTSAEPKKQCGCVHGDSDPYCPDPLCPNYIAAYHVKPAAPQSVSGQQWTTADRDAFTFLPANEWQAYKAKRWPVSGPQNIDEAFTGMATDEAYQKETRKLAGEVWAGDAPKVEEIAKKAAAEIFAKVFRFDPLRSEQIEKIILRYLRPYFPPASQTPPEGRSKRGLRRDIKYLKERIEVLEAELKVARAPAHMRAQAITEVHANSMTVARHPTPNGGRATPASTARTDGWVSVEERLPEDSEIVLLEPVLREWWKRSPKITWTVVDGEIVRLEEKQIVGLMRPNNDVIDNLFPACPPCNLDKHCMSVEAWRGIVADKVRVLRDNYTAFGHAERFGLLQEIKKPIVFWFELCMIPSREEK